MTSLPVAGEPIAGVRVYATLPLVAILPFAPRTFFSETRTAQDGSFSLRVPESRGIFGIVAIDGALTGNDGVSSAGYTVARRVVRAIGAPPTLYLDHLTPSEQTGFREMNGKRAASNLYAVYAETSIQMFARMNVAFAYESPNCQFLSTGTWKIFENLDIMREHPPLGDYYVDSHNRGWTGSLQGSTQSNVLYAGMAKVVRNRPCKAVPTEPRVTLISQSLVYDLGLRVRP